MSERVLPMSGWNYSIGASLLEEIIESASHILRRRCALAGSSTLVWNEEVAEVCFLSVGHPFGLRLAASVVRCRVVIFTVQARMNVCAAASAFVRA